MNFIARWLATAVAVAAAAWIVPGIDIVGGDNAWIIIAVFALVLSLVNIGLKPILQTLSLPLTPYGVPRLYGARASDTVDGTEQWSDRTIGSGAESSTDIAGYLVSDDGVDWMQIRMRDDTARRRVEAIDVTYGLTGDGEAPTAAVEYSPPQGWAGTTTLLGVLPADRAAIIDFWDAHRLFWIRFPAEVKGATIHDGGAVRVARTSHVEAARIVQVAATPRDMPLEWVEQ